MMYPRSRAWRIWFAARVEANAPDGASIIYHTAHLAVATDLPTGVQRHTYDEKRAYAEVKCLHQRVPRFSHYRT